MGGASQNRVRWIDEYKGFVLLLVCLFHMEQAFKSVDFGMLHLSAFRMSAFFYISGVLFSTRRFTDFKSYALHKTKVLLLPYIWLSLLFLALDPVIYNFSLYTKAPKMVVLNTYPVITNVTEYIGWNFAKIFVAGKSSIGSGPIWFVFTLYSISLMFYGVQKFALLLSSRAPTRNLPCAHKIQNPALQKIIIAIVTAACFASGWALFRNHIRLPLGIERDLTCLGFFAMGWLSKDFINGCHPSRRANVLKLFIAIAAFALYAYFESPNPNFSIMNNDLGKTFWGFFASSIFGIIGLVATFQLSEKLPDVAPIRIVKGVLRNISRNALIILAVHWWILLVIRLTCKTYLDKPALVWIPFFIVIAFTVGAIPLFRSKFYKVIGKEKITAKESLSIK